MEIQRPMRSIRQAIAWQFGRTFRRAADVVGRFFRKGLPSHLERIGLREAETRDDLHWRFAVRTADWLVMACFAYRIVAAPITLIGAMASLGPAAELYALAFGGLILWNVFLTAAVLRPQIRAFLSSRLFCVIDLSLAVGANLWGAAILPQGTILLPYQDVFWTYALGTIAVWTTLQGARTGLILVAGGGGVLLGMTYLNEASLSGRGVGTILGQVCWLLSAVPLPVIIMRLGRQGAGLGNTEGRRAGRALERIRALRMIHDTALQTLAQIAQRAVATELSFDERTRHIHELANQQLAGLRSALLADDGDRTGLIDGLQNLVRWFGAQNLRVELLTAELASDPPQAIADGLLGATREALTNAYKHAGIDHVIVRAATTGNGYELVIRDHGRGFDTTVHHSGTGLRESIQQRMSEIGGNAQIWSEPGRGTRVSLAVGFGSARQARGIGLDPHAAIALSPTRSTSVGALTDQALAWFIVAALAYRVVLSPLQATTLFANLDLGRTWLFLGAMVGVFTFDVALLVALLLGRFARLFRSRTLLFVDLSLTAGLNLWSAYVLPTGTVLAPGHEVLWGYTMGAVAFWTGLRGLRTGLAIVGGGIVLQLAMAHASQAALTAQAWTQFAIQQGWLTAAFALSLLLTKLARRGAQQAVDDGVTTGLAIERAWALRDLYSEVARSLSVIVDKTKAAVTPQELMDIRGTALDQVDRLRATIDPSNKSSGSRLAEDLGRVASAFRGHGLRVELVTSQLSSDPPRAVADSLLAATTEALRNVIEHASVPHAVLRASNVLDGFEITIRDHGMGSPAQEHSSGPLIRERMAEIGGHAEIWSELGSGTRIQLRWRPSDVG